MVKSGSSTVIFLNIDYTPEDISICLVTYGNILTTPDIFCERVVEYLKEETNERD